MKKCSLNQKITRRTATGLAVALSMSMATSALAAVELTMYYPVAVGGPVTKVVDGIVNDFEKANPGIKVNPIYSGNYFETKAKALSALKSGKPPQLAILMTTEAFALMDKDLIVAFEDIPGVDKSWLKSFYPALMTNSMAEGKTWSIPFNRSTVIGFYNKDLFRKAGLDPNKPPKNWDELVSMGKKLATKDTHGILIPSVFSWPLYPFFVQNGAKMMSDDGKKTYFDAPEAIEAMQFIKDLSHKHGVLPKGVVGWGTHTKSFLAGKTAMLWDTTGNLTNIKNNAKFDLGVTKLPGGKSVVGGGNFYIFKDASAEERAASLKLIKYMSSPEVSAKFSVAVGYMGLSDAAYNTKTLKDYTKSFPEALIARDQLKDSGKEFATYDGRVGVLLSKTIQKVITGKESAKDAMMGAQKEAERLLKPYQ